MGLPIRSPLLQSIALAQEPHLMHRVSLRREQFQVLLRTCWPRPTSIVKPSLSGRTRQTMVVLPSLAIAFSGAPADAVFHGGAMRLPERCLQLRHKLFTLKVSISPSGTAFRYPMRLAGGHGHKVQMMSLHEVHQIRRAT